MCVNSTIFLPRSAEALCEGDPPTSTCNASSRRRAPLQRSHGSEPKRYLVPRPLQSGQAPYGELKEKRRGSISGNEKPSFGQAHLADMRNSSSSCFFSAMSLNRSTMSPSDSLIAFSIDSDNLS